MGSRSLRLCRGYTLQKRRRKSRPCLAFACRDGYCWFHHLCIFGGEMWGDHLWMATLETDVEQEAAGA